MIDDKIKALSFHYLDSLMRLETQMLPKCTLFLQDIKRNMSVVFIFKTPSLRKVFTKHEVNQTKIY